MVTSIFDIDTYTWRDVAAILRAQGRARYIDSHFSCADDEWRDIRALRASCRYFAHIIDAPRTLSEDAQIYIDRVHPSRAIQHIFRTHFSAQSLLMYMSRISQPQEDMTPVIAMGSRLDRVMRECASIESITWPLVIDTILREFGLLYITNDELPEDAHIWCYDIVGTCNDDANCILFDHNVLSPDVNFILRQIIEKYLVQLMCAYGIKDDEHARICDLLRTSNPASVQLIPRANIDTRDGSQTRKVIFERGWRIRNFRAILNTDRETMRARCLALFAQFPQIDLGEARISETDRADLFLRDSPIHDIMLRYWHNKLGTYWSECFLYAAMLSPFVSCDELRACAQRMQAMGDDFARTATILRDIVDSSQCHREIIDKHGARHQYISIAHNADADATNLARFTSLPNVFLSHRKPAKAKSLCALYLQQHGCIERMFAQFPRKNDIDIIVTFIEFHGAKIASYGIDANEMWRKFCDFRARNYASRD